MKNLKILTIGILGLSFLASCGGNGKKFEPKDRTTSTMSDSEREKAINAKKSALAVDPYQMMNSNDVKLSIMPPSPEGDLNEELSEKIAVKMLQMISQNGIGGLNTVPGFALTATLTNGEKKTTGTAPQKMVAGYTINYSVINTVSGDVYASTSQEITGVGNSFEQATRNAIKEIKNTPAIQNMLSTASEKIIAWFEENLDTFKSQVETAYGKEDYSLALSLIESVPQKATNAFAYAQGRREDVLSKFKSKIAVEEFIALKQAIQDANGHPSSEVYAHLSMLPTGSKEYTDAMKLINDYESTVVKTLSQEKTEAQAKAEAEAQRALQLELASIEAERLKAKYQAKATEQALRQHMRDKEDQKRGFWGNLGARIIGVIDQVSDASADEEDDVVKNNLPKQ